MPEQPADTLPGGADATPVQPLSEDDWKRLIAASEKAATDAVDAKVARYGKITGITSLAVLVIVAGYISEILPEKVADLLAKRHESKSEALLKLLEGQVKTASDQVTNLTARAKSLANDLEAADKRIGQQNQQLSEAIGATERELGKLRDEKDRLRKQVDELTKLDFSQILSFARNLKEYQTPERVLTQLTELKADLEAYANGKKRMTALRAGRFVLDNDKGLVKGFFQFDDRKRPELILENVGDKRSMRLGFYSEGTPSFSITDERGVSRLESVVVRGMPGLRLFDHEQRLRGEFFMDEKGQPRLVLSAEEGLEEGKGSRLALDVGDGQPRLVLLDESGARCKVFLWPNGLPEIQLNDSKGTPRFVNRLCDPDGLPEMLMYDRDGKLRLAWGLHKAGFPWRNPRDITLGVYQ